MYECYDGTRYDSSEILCRQKKVIQDFYVIYLSIFVPYDLSVSLFIWI